MLESNVWRTASTLLVILCAGYLGLVALAYVFQSRLIYFPERDLSMNPDTLGFAYRPVPFQAEDGVRLHGWFIPAEASRGVLLFCHGNAGNMSHRLESIALFRRLGLSTFIFDYRGYGRSQGKPSEQGTYLDAMAAWNLLVLEYGFAPKDIVVFGRSLGASVGAWVARQQQPGALILESAFTSIPDLGADLYRFLPVRWLARFRYDTLEYVRQVRCPVLIVHSPSDEIIPLRHGRLLHEAANHPKEFLEIKGSHNEGFILSGRRYLDGLDGFLSRNGFT